MPGIEHIAHYLWQNETMEPGGEPTSYFLKPFHLSIVSLCHNLVNIYLYNHLLDIIYVLFVKFVSK